MVDVYPTRRARARASACGCRACERVLGIAPPRDEARRILVGLGLPVTDRGDDLEVEVPSFRRDLAMEDDLVEEIIRVWGYDHIPSTLVPTALQLVEQPPSLRHAGSASRRALVGAGLSEVVDVQLHRCRTRRPCRAAPRTSRRALVNPLSQDAALLRHHPLEGVLAAVAHEPPPPAAERPPLRDRPHVRSAARRHARAALGSRSR